MSSESSTHEFSVLIPAYNHAQYIKQAVMSALRSPFVKEVLLVDDGSADGTASILASLTSKNPERVRNLTKNGQTNRGTHNRLNELVEAAQCSWVAVLNSDDIFVDGRFEAIITHGLFPESDFLFGNLLFVGAAGTLVGAKRGPFDTDNVFPHEFDVTRMVDGGELIDLISHQNFVVTTSNMVFTKDLHTRIGGFSAFRYVHDWDFALRAMALGRCSYVRRYLTAYRMHATNTINEGSAKVHAESRTLFDRLLADFPQLAKRTYFQIGLRNNAYLTSTQSTKVVDHKAANRGDCFESSATQPPRQANGERLSRTEIPLAEVAPKSVSTERYVYPSIPHLLSLDRWKGKKTTILYLIPFFHIGGAESFDLRIMSCLPKEHYSIILVACEQPEGPLYDEFKARADEIYSLEKMAQDRDNRSAFLRYLMIAKCVDIVFNRNTLYGYQLADEWPLVSRQVRFADLLHLHAFGEDWVRASAPYDRKLDLRFVTSEDLPEYAARVYKLSRNRFRQLDYGFEPEELPDEAACTARRHAIRERWNIPAQAFVVGFIGRVTDQKDPLRWLSVAAEIDQRRSDTVFLMVGGGELMDNVKAAAADRGLGSKIIFTNYQLDATHYCAAMDVLLMTSKYEGLPLVVLHALAHGTPVVSSDVGGIRWCVTERAGRVLPVGHSDAVYAEAVVDMGRIRVSDASISAQCRARVSARFTKDRMRQQLQDGLSSLTMVLNREKRLEDYQHELMSRPTLSKGSERAFSSDVSRAQRGRHTGDLC
jgi:glycosyltransferase involved in cell wall biosynthesis